MYPELRLRYLGPTAVSGQSLPDFGARKAEALLCYLAVTGRCHRRTELAALLWGDFSEARARTNLRGALAKLRRHIPHHLHINRRELCFDRQAPHWLDVVEFERAIGRASAAPEPDIEQLKLATELYKGDFLQGFFVRNACAFEEWVLVERSRLRNLALTSLSQLSEMLTRQGAYREAIQASNQLLIFEPWREEAHRQLMWLLARSGRRRAALAQFEACRELLQDELGIAPSAETAALRDAIESEQVIRSRAEPPVTGPGAAAVSAPQPTIAHNLPYEPSPFIDRQRELEQLDEFFHDDQTRLVTIVGPGGMGKTRLALAAARRQLEPTAAQRSPGTEGSRFRNGITFVSLVAATSTSDIVSSLAQSLNFSFRPGSGSSKQQILKYLRRKRQLLILDNFEQLLAHNVDVATSEHGANFVAELLSVAPDVFLLVTSRDRLHLLEEQLLPIEGLDYLKLQFSPGAKAADDGRSGAGRLFRQCARRRRPDFAPSPTEEAQIVEICQLVGGMPLGIELAATWVESIPLSEIATAIQHGLDILTSEMHNVPERHRSMRAVFDASWRLLSQAERAVFAQLSVFRGGFTWEAAEQVVLRGEGERLTPGLLTRLIDKSLVQFRPDQQRYQVHALLHQYGGERLAAPRLDNEASQLSIAHNRHSAYYCEALQQWRTELLGPRNFEIQNVLDSDIANVQAAWKWAVTHGRVARVDKALEAMYDLYMTSFRAQDGKALLDLTAERLTQLVKVAQSAEQSASLAELERILAKVLARQGALAFFLDQVEHARQLVGQSQAVLSRPTLVGKDIREEKAFLCRAKAFVARPDWSASLIHMEESLSLYRELGDPWSIAFTLNQIAYTNASLGSHEQALEASLESLTIFRTIGDKLWTAATLLQLGDWARQTGDYDEADRRYQESLQLGQTAGDQNAVHRALRMLGSLKLFLGSFEKAEDYFKESIAAAAHQRKLLPDTDTLTVRTWAELSIAYGLSGDIANAKISASHGLALAEALDDETVAALLMTTQGENSAWVGEYELARRQAQAALDLGQGKEILVNLAMPHYRPAHAYRVLGWVELATESFTNAQALLRQSVVGYQEGIVDEEKMAWSLIALARANYGLGHGREARQQLLTALENVVRIRAFVPLLHLMPIIAVMLSGADDAQHKERAVALYALAQSHPFVANARLFEDIAGRYIAATAATLPATIVEEARVRGRALDWWATANALLEELPLQNDL